MVESERLDIQTIDKLVYDAYGVVLLHILVYAGREKEANSKCPKFEASRIDRLTYRRF